MSFQWTIIASYLYLEIVIVLFMILPIFTPKIWNQFFQSRLFAILQRHAAMYFYVILGVLSLFLMDAIREMRKYSYHIEGTATHVSSEMKVNVKLFRAQRNFYITGFAIFLAFVIRRLVAMLILQEELRIKARDIIKEAETTINLAKYTIISNNKKTSESAEDLDEARDQLQLTEELLALERGRSEDFKQEAAEWKSMYKQLKATMASAGKGDE